MYDIPIDLKWLESKILEYEQMPIEKGKILFYGHSMFTRWSRDKWGHRPLEEEIRNKDGSLACVNHGFGTSTSEELLYYYPRMVRPWEPRALVLMTFANDGMYGYSPEDVMVNVSKICHWARTDFPGIRLFLVSDHPHPSTQNTNLPDKWVNYYHRKNKFNQLLSLYAQTHGDTTFIDLWKEPGFFEEGAAGDPHSIRKELFVEDGVHLNQAGYDVLAPIMKKALDDLL